MADPRPAGRAFTVVAALLLAVVAAVAALAIVIAQQAGSDRADASARTAVADLAVVTAVAEARDVSGR